MEDLYKNMRYPDGVKGDIFKRRVFCEMVNDVATGGSVASAKEFAKETCLVLMPTIFSVP